MTGANDDWTKCDPHEITKLATRLRGRRQLRAARRAAFVGATAIAAVAVIVLAIWTVPDTDDGPDFAGISCRHVDELASAYMKKELPTELQDQVRRHVALCPICRERMDAMPAVSWRHHSSPDSSARAQSQVVASRGSSS